MEVTKLRDWLESGRPIMIYDSENRESEVDLVYYAPSVTPSSIYTLRTLAGGLICFAMPLEVGHKLGLRFMSEIMLEHYPELVKRPSYGDWPAFSLWVNHVSVKTGISDNDRALTIRKLVEVAEEGNREKFKEEFMSPGHVPILLARKIEERRGHTELSVRLVQALGLKPFTVFAEVLDYKVSMSLDKAKEISKSLGLPLLKGEEIVRIVGMKNDSNIDT